MAVPAHPCVRALHDDCLLALHAPLTALTPPCVRCRKDDDKVDSMSMVCASISSGEYAGTRITGMLTPAKRVPLLLKMLQYSEAVLRDEHAAAGAHALQQELTLPSGEDGQADGLALWAGALAADRPVADRPVADCTLPADAWTHSLLLSHSLLSHSLLTPCSLTPCC